MRLVSASSVRSMSSMRPSKHIPINQSCGQHHEGVVVRRSVLRVPDVTVPRDVARDQPGLRIGVPQPALVRIADIAPAPRCACPAVGSGASPWTIRPAQDPTARWHGFVPAKHALGVSARCGRSIDPSSTSSGCPSYPHHACRRMVVRHGESGHETHLLASLIALSLLFAGATGTGVRRGSSGSARNDSMASRSG